MGHGGQHWSLKIGGWERKRFPGLWIFRALVRMGFHALNTVAFLLFIEMVDRRQFFLQGVKCMGRTQ